MKKVLLGFFLCGLCIVLLFGVLTYVAFSSRIEVEAPTALFIPMDGPVMEGESNSLEAVLSDSPPLSMQTMTEAIREAASDSRISGIVLNIINPQVGLAQIQEIEAAMSEFRQSEKWTIAFMESAGIHSRGDGSYALALCADEIYLAPPGALNLIGLQSSSPFFGGLLEKLKIKPFFNQRKEYKSGPTIFTHKSYTSNHKEQLKDVLDDLQSTLSAHIAKRRNVNLETAHEWVNSGPYTSTAAKEKGMVDHIGYFDSVLSQMRERIGREKPSISLRAYAQTLMPSFGEKTIAVITAAGTIHRGRSDSDPLSSKSTIGSTTYTKAFRKAREDKVDGVLFRISSGGGSYIASDLIRREVELTREAGIPVVVSMGSVAASGGYFIAMDANHIVAEPSTITGSIGVYTGGFATRTFFKEYFGVTFDSYNTSKNADVFDTLDPPAEKQKALVEKSLDLIYADFVGKMAKARKKTFEEADAVARGRIWSGQKALTNGLVDELGGTGVALNRLRVLAKITPEESIQFQTYPIPDTPLAVFRKALSSGASITSVLRTGVRSALLALETSTHASLSTPEVELFH